MKFSIGHAQHIGKRKQQQDAFGFARSAGGTMAVVVADGMGGMAHGDKASRTAVDTFLAEWKAVPNERFVDNALLECMRKANAAVYAAAEELKAAGDVGTTLVAGAFADDGLHWISVGDSAIFHVRAGAMKQLNVFHNYGRDLDLLAEQGMVPRVVVMNHPEREALTSFVGMENLRLIDASDDPLRLKAGDWVLFATDGLFKTLAPREMVEGAKGAAQKACDDMVKRAIDVNLPYQDNVTMLAVHADLDIKPYVPVIAVTALGALGALGAWALSKRNPPNH